MVRDLDTLPPERLMLAGPAGRLSAVFERPAVEPRAAVLHLHPHPLGGGTSRNNVVRYGALGSLEAGCAALRFDFRGAGESEGEHDEGRGEVEDAAAALDALESSYPGRPLFVWGFSFGARVGLELVLRESGRVAGYLGVAWPTAAYELSEKTACPERMALLSGDRDEYVDLAVLRRFSASCGAELSVAEGAGHFFEGQLERVRRFTAATLASWL